MGRTAFCAAASVTMMISFHDVRWWLSPPARVQSGSPTIFRLDMIGMIFRLDVAVSNSFRTG